MSSDYPDSATAAQPAGELPPAEAPTPWSGYEQFRPRPKAERTPPRRWLVAVVVAWGAVLAAGIGWAVVNGEPTSRDQTTVAEALPVVDRAAVDIVAAVGADGQGVAAIADLAKATDCSISVVRPGERYQRVVNAFVTPGTEQHCSPGSPTACLRRTGPPCGSATPPA